MMQARAGLLPISGSQGSPLTCAFSKAAAHQARNGFWCLCVEMAIPWQGYVFIIPDRVFRSDQSLSRVRLFETP